MTATLETTAAPSAVPFRFTQHRDALGDPEWATTVPGPDGTLVRLTTTEIMSAIHLSDAPLRHHMPTNELAQLVTSAIAVAGADAIRAHSRRHHALCVVIATETTAEADWRAADRQRRRMWRNDHSESSDRRHALCQSGMLALIDAGRDAR